jgi:hypothetical protein
LGEAPAPRKLFHHGERASKRDTQRNEGGKREREMKTGAEGGEIERQRVREGGKEMFIKQKILKRR